MFESSFTLLRDIGSFPVAPGEEIRFTIDAYHGFRYVSIRRYVQSDGFAGATRDGVTLTVEIVQALAPRILALPDDPHSIAPAQLGKFAKRPGICIVVSVGEFKGNRGLDFRQWQQDIGWTKKGIWIALDKIKEVKELFKKTQEALAEQPVDDF